jgi:hypothetical protein
MVSGEIKQEKKPGSIFTAYHEVKQTAGNHTPTSARVFQ